MSGSTPSASTASSERPHRAGAFDVRNFIGALLGIYGVILVITGLIGTSDAEIAKSNGTNVNLWAGIGLVVVAAIFLGWARMRPVVVPAEHQEKTDDRPTGH